MAYETIKFDITDNVATITLARPDNANAMNLAMTRELFDVALRCSSDSAIRAVVLTAQGKMFCAGGDLKDFATKGDGLAGYVTEVATYLHAAVTRWQRMDAPLVVAVNGMAAGAGLSLVAGGDVVVASDQAAFVSAYTAAGITPDGSSTYFLAKHVGLMRAKELVLTNRRLDAREAAEWGLITRVVAADELQDEARRIATDFAIGPTKAYGGAKRLLLAAYEATLETQLEDETVGIANMTRTHDGREGIEAFAARRKPVFRGS
ncbi:MAG: enoyl-CoA hydratase/isomerase family protein [Alphaproteobacteria bacterium]|nr:enoyl-CoA hydratase/isomerase family protein [Alphaproteobacteria bacterium]